MYPALATYGPRSLGNWNDGVVDSLGDDDLEAALDDLSGRYGEPLLAPKPLFSGQDFGAVSHLRTNEILREIQEYRANELLNTGIERLLDYFYDKYSMNVPVLHEQNRSVQHREVEIEANDRFSGELKRQSGFRYREGYSRLPPKVQANNS